VLVALAAPVDLAAATAAALVVAAVVDLVAAASAAGKPHLQNRFRQSPVRQLRAFS
jgi:hypothetical protein